MFIAPPLWITNVQIVWLALALFVLLIVLAIVRFFIHHILKFLLHGCAIVLIFAAILFALHYFGVI